MARARRTGADGAGFAARAGLVVLAVVGAACGTAADVRAVRPLPPSSAPSSSAPSTTAPTTTLPPAVATTVPTPVVPVAGWSPPATTLPPAGGFTSASCISDVFCLAAGGGANEADASGSTGPGVVSSWDGFAWLPPSVYFPQPRSGPTTEPELPAIACTEGPRCAVVDGSGHTSLGDGTDWAAPSALPALPAPGPAPNPVDPGPDRPGSRSAAVACPAEDFCAYVDNTGHVATLRGTTWSVPLTMVDRSGPTPVGLFQRGRVGISCADASACTALVGTAALDWDGTTWTSGPGPWPAGSVGDSAVACPAPGTCLAVRGASVSVRTPGVGWSPPLVIDAGGTLDALSCPTTAFCVAADASGNVVALAGGRWSTPAKVVPTPVEYPGDGTSVSCPTDGFCLVLDGDGDYSTYRSA